MTQKVTSPPVTASNCHGKAKAQYEILLELTESRIHAITLAAAAPMNNSLLETLCMSIAAITFIMIPTSDPGKVLTATVNPESSYTRCQPSVIQKKFPTKPANS